MRSICVCACSGTPGMCILLFEHIFSSLPLVGMRQILLLFLRELGGWSDRGRGSSGGGGGDIAIGYVLEMTEHR